MIILFFFFFQAEDGIRDLTVTGVQTCALPIYPKFASSAARPTCTASISLHIWVHAGGDGPIGGSRSEEHTSELPSQAKIGCRLLLEKKKKNTTDELVRMNALSPLTARHVLSMS